MYEIRKCEVNNMDEYEILMRKKLEYAESQFNKAVNTGMKVNLVSYWQGAITALQDLLNPDPFICKVHGIRITKDNDGVFYCQQCEHDRKEVE